jgi:hypothetical protein
MSEGAAPAAGGGGGGGGGGGSTVPIVEVVSSGIAAKESSASSPALQDPIALKILTYNFLIRPPPITYNGNDFKVCATCLSAYVCPGKRVFFEKRPLTHTHTRTSGSSDSQKAT